MSIKGSHDTPCPVRQELLTKAPVLYTPPGSPHHLGPVPLFGNATRIHSGSSILVLIRQIIWSGILQGHRSYRTEQALSCSHDEGGETGQAMANRGTRPVRMLNVQAKQATSFRDSLLWIKRHGRGGLLIFRALMKRKTPPPCPVSSVLRTDYRGIWI